MFTDTRLNLLARRFLHNGLQLCRSEKPLFSRFRSQACALPSDHARRHAQRHTPTPSTEAASLRSRNQNCPAPIPMAHVFMQPPKSLPHNCLVRVTLFTPRVRAPGTTRRSSSSAASAAMVWSAVAKRIFQFRGEAQVSLAKEPNVLKPVASTVILL